MTTPDQLEDGTCSECGRQTAPITYKVSCETCYATSTFVAYEDQAVQHICHTSPAFWIVSPPVRGTTPKEAS